MEIDHSELMMVSRWRHELGLTDSQMVRIKEDLTVTMELRRGHVSYLLEQCRNAHEQHHVVSMVQAPLNHISTTYKEMKAADHLFKPVMPYPPRVLGSVSTTFFYW